MDGVSIKNINTSDPKTNNYTVSTISIWQQRHCNLAVIVYIGVFLLHMCIYALWDEI